MHGLDSIAYDTLLDQIKKLIELSGANNTMNACYWEVGRLIDKHLYLTEKKPFSPFYKNLSKDLRISNEKNKNFCSENLKRMRDFFKKWPISDELLNDKSDLERLNIINLKFPLKWSIYFILSKIDDTSERGFYEIEASNGSWDAERLKIHINENLYKLLHRKFLSFEFHELKDKYKNFPMLLYQQAHDFYDIFKPFLEHGYQPIPTLSSKAHTWKSLLAYMVNFHFYIELILKAILSTRKKQSKTHNLEDLLKKANITHIFDDDEKSVLSGLSQHFHRMRYKEGSLAIRYGNPKKFLEILKSISSKVEKEFKKSIASIHVE